MPPSLVLLFGISTVLSCLSSLTIMNSNQSKCSRNWSWGQADFITLDICNQVKETSNNIFHTRVVFTEKYYIKSMIFTLLNKVRKWYKRKIIISAGNISFKSWFAFFLFVCTLFLCLSCVCVHLEKTTAWKVRKIIGPFLCNNASWQ